MNFKLKLFEHTSNAIATEYDNVSLPYLIMYIMGNYSESNIGYALSEKELEEILIKKHPLDFAYIHENNDFVVFDILSIWEKYCGIWDIIKSISAFESFREL